MPIKNFIFVSDMHLTSAQPPGRTDNAMQTCLTKLEWILCYASQCDAAIIQAGDMFDQNRDWYLLPAVAALLVKYGVPVYTVYGQHDSYMRSVENRPATTLGVLAHAGLLTVLSSEPVHVAGWDLFGAGWRDKIPVYDPHNTNPKILVWHDRVAEEPAFPDHKYIDARCAFEELKDYDIILCGDVHRVFHVTDGTRHMLNTGPVFRYKAEEYNFTHTPQLAKMQVDRGGLEWHNIPHAPAAEVLTREHIPEPDKADMLLGFMSLLVRAAETQHERTVNIERAVRHALESPHTPRDIKDLMVDVMDTIARRARG